MHGVLVACSAGMFHRSRLRKQILHSRNSFTCMCLKFVGFYFRDVYEFLFTRRYVTARILAEESLEGQEVVFSVTTVCLVLRTAIVVQKGNLARTEKRCLQMLKQLLLRLPSSAFDRHQAAAAKSREEIGVRNVLPRHNARQCS